MKPGIIVDNFAGGGGASTGIEAALGRAIDIAINHDEEAIRMHEVNHPGTHHIRNNVWQVDPRDIAKGRHVQLAWFSPDCKHFSKAKGGKPREKSIRDLAWVVVLWAQRVKPDLILLENVEEFRTWGPLCPDGYPIKERAGETFAQWTKALRKAGYKMQWKELRACDYGAPTIRKRFFMIARCDGRPIVWPEPTHGKPGSADVLSGKLKPWRTAAEIIDWSIPCPSIFDRKKPLAEKTLRRIAHGIMKFVVNNPAPFIVPLTHAGGEARAYGGSDPLPTVTGANRGEMAVVAPHVTKFRAGAIGHAVDEPLHTVTANSFVKRPGGPAPLGVVEATVAPVIVGCGGRRGQSAPVGPQQPYPTTTAKADACLAAAHLVHIGNGEREGQAPRAMDAEKPLGTVVAGGIKHHAVTAFLERQFGKSKGAAADQPAPTTTAGGSGKTAVVAAHIAQFSETREGRKLNPGHSAEEPVSTIVQKGPLQAAVTSHLLKLRGTSEAHIAASAEAVDEPLNTISAQGLHMAEVRAALASADADVSPGRDREIAAFLVKYYGNEQTGHGLADPLGTVTVQDRFGLVTVTIDGEEYVIVDIGMRMLTPRELFNAQGFPYWERSFIVDQWRDQKTQVADDLEFAPASSMHAKAAEPYSSASPTRGRSEPAPVSVLIDLGRQALLLHNVGKLSCDASIAAGSAEFRLPTEIASIARMLAPASINGDRSIPIGVAASLASDKPSTRAKSGVPSASSSGEETTRGAAIANDVGNTATAALKCIISPGGHVTPHDASILTTLFSYAVNVIVSSIPDAIMSGSFSRPIRLEVRHHYIIDHDAQGRPITKTAQVAKCGNSVCPPLAEALVRANVTDAIAESEAVAA